MYWSFNCRIVVVFIFIIFFSSCGKKRLSPEEYTSYIKDYSHGLRVKKQINHIVFDLQYAPEDLLKLKLQRSGTIPWEEENNFEYFELDVRSNFSKEDWNKKMYYFSFNFQNDIQLITETDTLPCVLYHYERNYNLGEGKNFLLGFESKDLKREGSRTLSIDSPELGVGKVNIKISKEAINNIPQIEL